MSEKIIAIATQNQAKIRGIARAFHEHAQRSQYTPAFMDYKVPSGVTPTPRTEDEIIKGCANRLRNAMEAKVDAAMYVAAEGGIVRVGGAWVVRGCTVVYDVGRDEQVFGMGASVQVPSEYAHVIESAGHISDALDDGSGMLRQLGINGYFTGGEYGREDTFYDGTRICLALLDHMTHFRGHKE